jgi:argininosuccinate lyase
MLAAHVAPMLKVQVAQDVQMVKEPVVLVVHTVVKMLVPDAQMVKEPVVLVVHTVEKMLVSDAQMVKVLLLVDAIIKKAERQDVLMKESLQHTELKEIHGTRHCNFWRACSQIASTVLRERKRNPLKQFAKADVAGEGTF